MKVTLKFDTEDPEQKMELKRVMKADDMATVLWEIVSNVKRKVEFDIDWKLNNNQPIDHFDSANMVLIEINELIKEYNIEIEELVN